MKRKSKIFLDYLIENGHNVTDKEVIQAVKSLTSDIQRHIFYMSLKVRRDTFDQHVRY